MKFFSQLLILFVFVSSINSVYAQDVDKLRLTYNKKNANSLQTGVTVSNDGKLIAFIYADKTIKVLDATNGRVIRKLRGVHDDFFELRFNYNATKLISIGHGNKVAVIDIKSGQVLNSFELLYNVTRTAVSKTEDLMAFGMEEPQVDIYDLNNSRKVSSIVREGHHISGIDFDPSGENIAIAVVLKKGKKAPVTFHNIADGIKQYETEEGVYASVNFNQDGSKVYLAGTRDIFTGIVDEFDISTRTLRYLYTKFNRKSLTLYLGIEVYGETILAVSVDKKFEVIDVKSGRIILTTLNDKTKGLLGLKNFGVDSKRIFPLYDGKSFLINYTNNNITQIYNADAKNISGYIYSDSNDDLVVAARDGRLDGSVNVMSNIYWSQRKSSRTTPLASTFDQFFTPNLLPILLSSETTQSDVKKLVEALEMAPTVTISTPDSITNSTTKSIEISYLTQANGDPVKNVMVTVNGKTMSESTRGFKRLGEGITVSLVGGQNIIKLSAVSEKGFHSIPDQLIVNYSGAPVSSELYMLTVGLNQYKNPKYNLNYANADATAVKTMIAEGGQGIFQEVKEYFIKDSDATKEKIESTFQEISNTIGPEDVFVFYYAGHGVMSEEEEPMFYIAPYEVTQMYGNNEILNEKAISAAQLKHFSSTISAQKQLFILDACQSGGMTDMLAMRGAAEEKAIAQLARSTGTYWLTASGSEQFATEFAELGHGLFTYTLLEGLSGKADGGSMDKKITVKELSSYLNDRVPELSEQHKGQAQYPTSYGFGQDFPVVIVK